MLGWLRRKPAAAPATLAVPVAAPVDMAWRDGATLPIPDWARITLPDDLQVAGTPVEAVDAFWTSAAKHWLKALAAALPEGYEVRASGRFLLLSAMSARESRLFLEGCERARHRIRSALGTLAGADGTGAHVAIVFASEDDYYEYVSNYHDEGDHALSSGMCIHAGYVHFVANEGELADVEPVVAHELTHALLAHLPIPLWLNEGLAVNTEHQHFPALADPRRQQYPLHEMRARHLAYWNADTIQGFWSGTAFQAGDVPVDLAYDLARILAVLAANDEAAFRAFVAAADWRDAGMAADVHLGFPIEHLVEAVLGEGAWRPDPSTWPFAVHEVVDALDDVARDA